MKRLKTADEFFSSNEHWGEALAQLREIVLSAGVEETVKWGAPVYTLNGKHVVGIGAFKSYFGLWFFQGVFLKDTAKKLINAQENKTKALRQWRFKSEDELDLELVAAYVREAIENQKAGLEIKPDRNKKVSMPAELSSALTEDEKLNAAFGQLSAAKQREYGEYIGEAKREKTKLVRLEKIKPMILSKVGLNDKYRSC